eukprot:2219095-Pyramimonas_sp.AAC.1
MSLLISRDSQEVVRRRLPPPLPPPTPQQWWGLSRAPNPRARLTFSTSETPSDKSAFGKTPRRDWVIVT